MMVRKLNIIWICFFSAIFVYSALAFILNKISISVPDNPVLLLVIAVIAFSSCALSFVLRSRMIVQPIHNGSLDVKSEEGMKKLLANFIVVWAVCESIAIVGLVAVILSGNPILYAPFALVSVTLMLVNHPLIFGINNAS